MPEFFSYDPETGVTELFDYDNGKATIHTVQDIEPALERAKLSRDNNLRDHGIKENWFHYADIPLVFVMRLRKMGIELTDTKAVLEAINTYWPFLKYTNKNEGKKVATHFVMP
jgi:hypothetical protein